MNTNALLAMSSIINVLVNNVDMKRLYILLSLLLWSIPNIANAQFTSFGIRPTTTWEREAKAQRRFNQKFFHEYKEYQCIPPKPLPELIYAIENSTDEVTGQTTTRWSDGSSYVGLTDRGAMFVGTMTYADGSKYIGKWERNLPNGEGTFINPEGVAFTGKFKNGVPHGKGVIQDLDGRLYSARWVRGVLKAKSIKPYKEE